jgi:hypothetical protein
MYFCNKGFCPTENSKNSTCVPGSFKCLETSLIDCIRIDFLLFAGKYGIVDLQNNNPRSHMLNTTATVINSVGQYCLIYHYHITDSTAMKSLSILKEESATNLTIDSVNTSPINGWFERKVPFEAQSINLKVNRCSKQTTLPLPGRTFQIYFVLQRTSGNTSPTISLDEISLARGSCGQYS